MRTANIARNAHSKAGGKFRGWSGALGTALVATTMAAGSGAWSSAAVTSPAASAAPGSPAPAATSLQADFSQAAKEFRVPAGVLLALSYEESFWESHAGQPSVTGNYNVMGLTQVAAADLQALSAAQRRAVFGQRGDGGRGRGHSLAYHPSPAVLAQVNRVPPNDPALHTLDAAAALIHQPSAALRTSMRQSVRGGAALLAHYERAALGKLPANPGLWYAAVARYSQAGGSQGARLFARRVFSVIRHGAARTTSDGQRVVLPPEPSVTPDTSAVSAPGWAASTITPECPTSLQCTFTRAAYKSTGGGNYGNYDITDRPTDGDAIRYIVIHDTEGTYKGTISAFQNPSTEASAHYVVSSAGAVTQMVPTKDIAWHAGNWYLNMHAIGIENEGYALKGATWYTPSEYQSTAALVKYLAGLYSIPLDRQHIIGHDDVPGPTDSYVSGMHWDPGPYWDWNYFMKQAGAPISQPDAGSLPVGSEITIDPPFTRANEPKVTGCPTSSGGLTRCPKQPANFVYLRTRPSFTAPLLADPYIHASGPGTTLAWDWGDKAVSGQTFVVAGEQGAWTAIWYGGQKAWFDNPGGQDAAPATLSSQLVVTPIGSSAIPVYGRAYPAQPAYPPNVTWAPNPSVSPLSKYSIQPGQEYLPDLPGSPVSGTYANTNFSSSGAPNETVVTDNGTQYYPIRFNHRLAYVMASEVSLVPATLPPAYTPLTPVRVLGARTAAGGAPVGSGRTVRLQVTGQNGVPASGVTAVVLNVTALSPTAKSYLTVYPDGTARPSSASLYTVAGRTTAHLVTVGVGGDGAIDIYNRRGSVRLLADLAGYYATSGGAGLHTIGAVRILDTKSGLGGKHGPVGPGQTIGLQVTGQHGVPASGVTAVVVNLTAVRPTATSYVTVYPDGQPQPSTLNLYFYRGDKSANLVVAPVGSNGKIDLYNNHGRVNLLADLEGYYTAGSGAWLDTTGPIRYSSRVRAGKAVSLKVAGAHGVPPSGVAAVVLNVTSVNPSQAGYVIAYPRGGARPGTPNLYFRAGERISNLVVIPVGRGGEVRLYNAHGHVKLLTDLVGYYMN